MTSFTNSETNPKSCECGKESHECNCLSKFTPVKCTGCSKEMEYICNECKDKCSECCVCIKCNISILKSNIDADAKKLKESDDRLARDMNLIEDATGTKCSRLQPEVSWYSTRSMRANLPDHDESNEVGEYREEADYKDIEEEFFRHQAEERDMRLDISEEAEELFRHQAEERNMRSDISDGLYHP